ncbi:MAG TPA: hypothetical protein VH351_15495 [Bryobacteraceae bacterium]|jgi:hypothetical protein|nr:hypothetical protein [Bryobacteraceae bacterium]
MLKNEQDQKRNSKTGKVSARLTRPEELRVTERADAAGKTVSEWVRQVILESLDGTPTELRLMAFFTAQIRSVTKALEEWRQNRNLSDPNVQERIRRLAIEMAADDAEITQRMLELRRKERGAAA